MAENRIKTELIVGIFLLLGIVAVTWLAVRLGDISLGGDKRYRINAGFISASGLRPGTYVEAAGVRVGIVDRIEFDPENYEARVTLAIDPGVPISKDAVASIRTAGIIGDKFVKITPGGDERLLGDGMEIKETESSINLEELISKYVFESGRK
ncbi:MAG: outer membrane lipid asymmetry maintenance protein MlaD [Gammaproteobacteria bacterium]|nr:outer membrane lipid asymmetry maintenance protein MlaD [Gammaproteobacteria bacterium]